MKEVKLALLVTMTLKDGDPEATAEQVRATALEELDGTTLAVENTKGEEGTYELVVRAAVIEVKDIRASFEAKTSIFEDEH